MITSNIFKEATFANVNFCCNHLNTNLLQTLSSGQSFFWGLAFQWLKRFITPLQLLIKSTVRHCTVLTCKRKHTRFNPGKNPQFRHWRYVLEMLWLWISIRQYIQNFTFLCLEFCKEWTKNTPQETQRETHRE